MNWTAYCFECESVLESCPNGDFATAAANIHQNGGTVARYDKNGNAIVIQGGDKTHVVMVGFFVEPTKEC